MSDLFEVHDPPAGGLVKLQTRLDGLERNRRWVAGLVFAAPVVAGVTFFFATILKVGPQLPEPDVWTNPAMARYGARVNESAVVPHDASKLAVHPVETSNEDVLFYWVAPQ